MPELVSEDQAIRFTEKEIVTVAKTLAKAANGQSFWAFYGAMGAGKTTLIKALLAEAGVQETVASPTFSIVNEYHDREGHPVYHFDFYRIKNEGEAYDIGAEEYFDSGHWTLVEWPEKVPSLLPASYFELQLEIPDDTTRIVRYRNHA